MDTINAILGVFYNTRKFFFPARHIEKLYSPVDVKRMPLSLESSSSAKIEQTTPLEYTTNPTE